MKNYLIILALITGCAKQPKYDYMQHYSPNIKAALERANSGKSNYPTEEEIANLKYGKAPQEYKNIFEKIIKQSLKDPGSAKFRNIQKPIKMWGSSTGLVHYWLICGEVNAKNGFGGYAGFEAMGVRYFPNGSEIEIETLSEDGASLFTHAKLEYPCKGY